MIPQLIPLILAFYDYRQLDERLWLALARNFEQRGQLSEAVQVRQQLDTMRWIQEVEYTPHLSDPMATPAPDTTFRRVAEVERTAHRVERGD